MNTTEICPVCRAPNTTRQSAGANTVELHCPRCGRFQIQALAETQLLNNRPAFPPPTFALRPLPEYVGHPE